ncbi:MAG: AIR synthase-related protein, partial [Nitrolancea sp.]
CIGRDLHALHDPTEGGLATGIREIAIAAGTGVVVDRDQITVYPETIAICDLLEIDPLGLIASGALLAAVEPSRSDEALATLERAGIAASQIGTLVEDASAVRMRHNGLETDLPVFAVDEIARLFSTNQD